MNIVDFTSMMKCDVDTVEFPVYLVSLDSPRWEASMASDFSGRWSAAAEVLIRPTAIKVERLGVDSQVWTFNRRKESTRFEHRRLFLFR